MGIGKTWKQTIGLTTILSLFFATLPKTATAQNPDAMSRIANCREVNSPSGITVRNRPDGEAIGTIAADQNLYIANEGRNGWVPVETPMSGYVRAEDLSYCSGTATTVAEDNSISRQDPSEFISMGVESNCRQAKQANILIRKQPQGDIIGTLENEQNVYIANEGRNGWVPIEQPASGYVRANDLTECTPTVTVSPSSSNCRKVNTEVGLNVYTKPAGTVVSTLAENRYVSIANEGRNGWVPIEKPVDGYVNAEELTYCP